MKSFKATPIKRPQVGEIWKDSEGILVRVMDRKDLKNSAGYITLRKYGEVSTFTRTDLEVQDWEKSDEH